MDDAVPSSAPKTEGGASRGRASGRAGLVVFFTGLPAAGKSSIASRLEALLRERTGRAVTLLDGDVVRGLLSSGLGYSREDRDLNVRRIGFVASEIARHGGIALCAQIAPFVDTRREVRAMVEAHGVFVEVYVATPPAVCESRDGKGLYRRARAGELDLFTGITGPYEPPAAPDVVVDGTARSPQQCAEAIFDHLVSRAHL